MRAEMVAGLTLLSVVLFSVVLMAGHDVRADERRDAAEDLDYASPLEVLLSPDSSRLYVLCQGSEEVRVLDANSYASIGNIMVGRVPRGFTLSPEGSRLFVTNSWDDTISVIDTRTLAVVATWPVGAEPSSVVEDLQGKRSRRMERGFTRRMCIRIHPLTDRRRSRRSQ
jgi:YVTN family beta-propeller protein